MVEIPKVTVITPVTNLVDNELTDEFSLLVMLLFRQNYPNIEHIVIDNGSTDGTVQVLMDYKNKGYLQFYSEKDTGKFDAMNKGIMYAKGKYVTFLNCDDYIHDIMAVSQIVELMENYNADFSFGTSYAIHPEGVVFPFEPAMYNAFQVMPCARQAMFFKKSVLEKEGYFDKKLKTMADFDLIMRLMLKQYTGVRYDKNYVTYRISATISENSDMIMEECKSIYIKNFRGIYPLTQDIVDKITAYSEFPQGLLDKLAELFPEDQRENFMAANEEMHKIRLAAARGEMPETTIEESDTNSEENSAESDTATEESLQSSSTATHSQNKNPSLQTRPDMSAFKPQLPPRFRN